MLKTPLQDPRNIGSTAWGWEDGCNHVSEGLPVHETLLKSTARLLEPMFTQLNLWKYCFLYAVLSLVFTVHCKCHILKCCNHLNRIIALTRRDLVNYTCLLCIFSFCSFLGEIWKMRHWEDNQSLFQFHHDIYLTSKLTFRLQWMSPWKIIWFHARICICKKLLHTTSFPKTWRLTLIHVALATKGVRTLCEVHKRSFGVKTFRIKSAKLYVHTDVLDFSSGELFLRRVAI